MTKTISEMYMTLELGPQGLRPTAYRSLLSDSEANAATALVGAAMAKLVAERLLGVPILHLVRPLLSAGVLRRLVRRRIQADFVGWDAQGRWHAIEAKARSGRVSKSLVRLAKQQASNLVFVTQGGRRLRSATSCGCITAMRDPLSVVLDDPEEAPSEPFVLEVHGNRFLRAYFRPVRALLDADLPLTRASGPLVMGTPDFYFARLPDSEHSLGIHGDLLDLIERDPQRGWVTEVGRFLSRWRPQWDEAQFGSEGRGVTTSFGLDGVALHVRGLLDDQWISA